MHEDEEDESGDHKRARDPSPARAKLVETYEDPIDKQAREAESIDDRVLAIAYLITQGRWNNLKILQYANLWACSIETVRSYGKDAARFQRLLKGKKKFSAHVREVDAQLRTAYELAIANGDAKGAVAAAKARGELFGVFAPKKIAATDTKGKDVPPANLPKPPPHIQRILDHPMGKRLWALQDRLPTEEQMAQLDAGVPLLEVAKNAGLLPGGLPD